MKIITILLLFIMLVNNHGFTFVKTLDVAAVALQDGNANHLAEKEFDSEKELISNNHQKQIQSNFFKKLAYNSLKAFLFPAIEKQTPPPDLC